jgi:hypothetical protein
MFCSRDNIELDWSCLPPRHIQRSSMVTGAVGLMLLFKLLNMSMPMHSGRRTELYLTVVHFIAM